MALICSDLFETTGINNGKPLALRPYDEPLIVAVASFERKLFERSIYVATSELIFI